PRLGRHGHRLRRRERRRPGHGPPPPLRVPPLRRRRRQLLPLGPRKLPRRLTRRKAGATYVLPAGTVREERCRPGGRLALPSAGPSRRRAGAAGRVPGLGSRAWCDRSGAGSDAGTGVTGAKWGRPGGRLVLPVAVPSWGRAGGPAGCRVVPTFSAERRERGNA